MPGGDDGDVGIVRHRYYKRQFINGPGHHSTAFVYAVVEKSRASDEYSGELTLTIADCCRSITLSIDIDSEENRKNTLLKLDAVIETLTGFRRAYRQECDVQRRRENRKAPVKKVTAKE